MRKFIAFLVVAGVVIGIVVLARGGHAKTRDLAHDACQNIVDQCGSLADPKLAPKIPDIGSCVRYLDSEIESDAFSQSLATCMADADSCEAVVGCGLTEGLKERRRRGR